MHTMSLSKGTKYNFYIMDENVDNRSLAQPFLAYQLSSISGFAAGPLIISVKPRDFCFGDFKN